MYAILRFSKHKGGSAGRLEAHHERKKEKYNSNPDIDKNRTANNYHLITPQGKYYAQIMARIEAAKCKLRKDSVKFVDTLITASNEFFSGMKPDEITAYFTHALDFIRQSVGENNIISAVIHMDEKTPHMHLVFVPLTKDNRLSAKEVLGNPKAMTEWQDRFHAHMSAQYPDLERGIPASETKRVHIPVRLFKQAVQLTQQLDEIQDALDGIGALNAKKKAQEAISLLEMWYPKVERFESQIKRLERRFDALKAENTALSETVDQTDKQWKDAFFQFKAMEVEAKKYRRMINALPPDVREQLERGLQAKKKLTR